MKLDKVLIGQINLLPKSTKEDEDVEKLIEEYTVAVGLSNGPNPNRCAYWEKQSIVRRNRLQVLIEKYDAPKFTKNK